MSVEALSGRSGVDVVGIHRGIPLRVRALRAEQVALGRDLLSLQRAGSFGRFGTTTFPLYCEAAGVSVSEGRELVAMAEACEASPGVLSRVTAGSLSVASAGMVGEVLRRPELQRPGEDFLALALRSTSGDLRDVLRKRREEARLPEPPVSLRFEVSAPGRDSFRRCHDLVSRKAGRVVTEGQAFETVCDSYLEHNDPERKAARLLEKDLEAEASLKGSLLDGRSWLDGRRKALPALTERLVLRRFGDRCRVKGCDERVFLQNAHLRPVRAGGSSFPWDLARLCWTHHKQLDGGEWFLREKADGTVVMIDRRGVRVGRLVTEAEILALPPAEAPP